MDENIAKALSICSVVFFLIGAITLFFFLYRDSNDTIGLVNEKIADKGVVYRSLGQDADENGASGASITASLKNGLETDIVIDSIFVSKTASPDSFDYTLIDMQAMYLVEYVFGANGEISMVRYRKR